MEHQINKRNQMKDLFKTNSSSKNWKIELWSKLFQNYFVSLNAQTPGLPSASDGQVITKEVNFYEKVGKFNNGSVS